MLHLKIIVKKGVTEIFVYALVFQTNNKFNEIKFQKDKSRYLCKGKNENKTDFFEAGYTVIPHFHP